eukprot:5288351-Pleurochrysis_carterae.AAC.1
MSVIRQKHCWEMKHMQLWKLLSGAHRCWAHEEPRGVAMTEAVGVWQSNGARRQIKKGPGSVRGTSLVR